MIWYLLWGVGGFIVGAMSRWVWELLALIAQLDDEAEERLE